MAWGRGAVVGVAAPVAMEAKHQQTKGYGVGPTGSSPARPEGSQSPEKGGCLAAPGPPTSRVSAACPPFRRVGYQPAAPSSPTRVLTCGAQSFLSWTDSPMTSTFSLNISERNVFPGSCQPL